MSSSLAFLALLSVSASGLTLATELSPNDFGYGMPIDTVNPAAAYRVTIPLEVYRKITYEDLRDIRVFNANGDVVPYELQQTQSEASVQPQNSLPLFPLRGDARVSLDRLRVTIESQGTAVDLHSAAAPLEPEAVTRYVLDARDLKLPVSGFDLRWPDGAPEFSGSVRVESSDDLGSWHVVKTDVPITNLRASGSELILSHLEFPSTKAKFWRLTWVGRAAPFELKSVTADSTTDRPVVPRSNLTISGVPVAAKPDELAFDLSARVPVTQIDLQLPESNSAIQVELLSRGQATDAWRPIAEGEFYRVRGRTSDHRNEPIRIPTNFDRLWLVRQVQPTGTIGDVKLTVTWSEVDLVFLARGKGPFLLAYGNSSASAASIVLGSLLQGVDVLRASLGEPHPLGGTSRLQPAPRTVQWKLIVMWAALGCGVGLLAWMAYRLTREMGTRLSGSQ